MPKSAHWNLIRNLVRQLKRDRRHAIECEIALGHSVEYIKWLKIQLENAKKAKKR